MGLSNEERVRSIYYALRELSEIAAEDGTMGSVNIDESGNPIPIGRSLVRSGWLARPEAGNGHNGKTLKHIETGGE